MLAITGITGHTGGFFLKELEKEKYEGHIKCLIRSRNKAEWIKKTMLDIELIEGNLNCEDEIRMFLNAVDVVVHIANIRYSSEILRIGKECGVKRFILVHTTGVYSKYKSASREYIDIEKNIYPMMKEMNITILRPTMIFGDMCDHNISKFIRFIDRFWILPIVAGGKSLIQPVNARDLAKALYKVIQVDSSKGKAYDLSGETVITIRELYYMICKYLNKKRLVISFPMCVCKGGAYIIKIFTNGKIDLVEKVLRMGENRAYEHKEATKDFGYKPESFEIGLRREINEYMETY